MGGLLGCIGGMSDTNHVAHATSRGIQLDGIEIHVEGEVDMRGFAGISDNVRPGDQQFIVNLNIKISSASN